MNKKTIIIVSFIVVLVGLVCYFGPLMVSSSALAMAAVDTVAQDFPTAMEHLNLAIKMDPHSVPGYQYRGYLYSQLLQTDKAIADFTEAIKYGGGSDCFYGRGLQYHQIGKLDLALKDYQGFLDKQPAKKFPAWLNMSDAHYRLDDVQRSLTECNSALGEEPKDSTALLNRSQCYYHAHRYKSALDDLSNALDNVYRHNGSNTPDLKRDCYLMRANTYRALQQVDEAESDMSEARRAAHVHHKSTVEARVLETDFSQKAIRRHFALCSNLSEKENNLQADRLETFLTFVDKNLCRVKVDRNFRIFSFPNADEYQAYITKRKLFQTFGMPQIEAREPADQRSRYEGDHDAVFTYSLPNLSGTVGSIMQKVLSDLPFGDKWAPEGFSALMSDCKGYATNNDCQLFLPQDANCYPVPDSTRPLVEIINNARTQTDDAEARLVALFLVKTGKWKNYAELCQSGEMADYATTFEATFQKRVAQIEPEWKSFLKELETDKQKGTPGTAKLPKLQIFQTKQEFEKMSGENQQLKLMTLTNLAPPSAASSSSQTADHEKKPSQKAARRRNW